jgi:sulfate permease, SulP family
VRSGGKTRLSGVIHGVALGAIILVFAPLASQIPLAALAGILMVTSVRMSDLSMAKIPETEVFPSGIPLKLSQEIAVYRVGGPVFFGEAERFVTFLREEPEVKYLILRLRFVPNIDTTGIVALEDIYYDLKRHDCRLMLTGLQPQVKEVLERSGLLTKIGLENCFESTTQAICSLHPDAPECALPNVKIERSESELLEV